MHGTITLGGPLVWFLYLLLYGSWGMSLYVVIDSVRRGSLAFRVLREGRLFYLVPEALYFVLFALNQIPKAPVIGYVVLFAVPFAIGHQVAYLLRVTFPTQVRREALQRLREEELEREAAEADAERESGEPAEAPDDAPGPGPGSGPVAEGRSGATR